MNVTVICSRICVLILVATVFAACSSTKNTSSSGQNQPPQVVDKGYSMSTAENANQSNIMMNPNKNQPSNVSLDELIRRLPGVRVQSGRGAYTRFIVSGAAASFMSGTDPLFVVDGQVIGSDFSNVYTLVNPKDVTSMSVLKGPDATIYGTRGANGVILIRTKLDK